MTTLFLGAFFTLALQMFLSFCWSKASCVHALRALASAVRYN
jgi:hypothetical protein